MAAPMTAPENVTRYAVRLNTVSVVCEHFTPQGPEGTMADVPDSAARLCLDLLRTVDQDQETFGFLVLDGRHRVTGFKLLTLGTATQAPVDGGKLFRCALAMDARGLILFHNHPSGNLEPSRDDLDLTRRLVQGGHLIGAPIQDHIILTPQTDRWLSLRSARPEIFTA